MKRRTYPTGRSLTLDTVMAIGIGTLTGLLLAHPSLSHLVIWAFITMVIVPTIYATYSHTR